MHTPPSTALLPACTTPAPIQLYMMPPEAAGAGHHSFSSPLKDPLQASSPPISSTPHTKAKLLDKGFFSDMTVALCPSVPQRSGGGEEEGQHGMGKPGRKMGVVREPFPIYLKVL